jgi:hypothetical protein
MRKQKTAILFAAACAGGGARYGASGPGARRRRLPARAVRLPDVRRRLGNLVLDVRPSSPDAVNQLK